MSGSGAETLVRGHRGFKGESEEEGRARGGERTDEATGGGGTGFVGSMNQ